MVCHKFGSPIGPHQESEMAHSRHEPGPDSPDCIDCHMPKIGQHTGKSPHTVRAHVFRFVYPQETIDYGTPNACNNCHSESSKSVEWARKRLEEWGMTTWQRY
jgi:formate-dependent nitrite reductase cytochrome c552 subunit